MNKVIEIIKIEVVSRFNHIQVKTQEYLVEGSPPDEIKTKLGVPNREVISCGDVTRLTELGLKKKLPPSEWWPQSLIAQWVAYQASN